jgi:hypothetical protein
MHTHLVPWWSCQRALKDSSGFRALSKTQGGSPERRPCSFIYSFPQISTGLTRPRKELKAFHKVFLLAGETDSVQVTLDKYSVSFYDALKACWRIDKGDYVAHVDLSATEIVAHLPFCV